MINQLDQKIIDAGFAAVADPQVFNMHGTNATERERTVQEAQRVHDGPHRCVPSILQRSREVMPNRGGADTLEAVRPTTRRGWLRSSEAGATFLQITDPPICERGV